jgi:hypothetical protein
VKNCHASLAKTIRLLITAASNTTVAPMYEILSVLFANLKDNVLFDRLCTSALFAWWNIKATISTAVSFIAMNSAKLVLTRFDMKGLSSIAPKYAIPITVVRQSIDPARRKAILGTDLALNIFCVCLSYEQDDCRALRTKFQLSAYYAIRNKSFS